MRYYSHVLDLPFAPPYDQPNTRFMSWLGKFFMPLAETGLCDRYWFTNYGDHVKFRFYTDKYDELNPEIGRLIQQCGLTLRGPGKETDIF